MSATIRLGFISHPRPTQLNSLNCRGCWFCMVRPDSSCGHVPWRPGLPLQPHCILCLPPLELWQACSGAEPRPRPRLMHEGGREVAQFSVPVAAGPLSGLLSIGTGRQALLCLCGTSLLTPALLIVRGNHCHLPQGSSHQQEGSDRHGIEALAGTWPHRRKHCCNHGQHGPQMPGFHFFPRAGGRVLGLG